MPSDFWKAPAWQLPVERVNRLELFRVPGRDIIPSGDWPTIFWPHVADRVELQRAESLEALGLFARLASGEPALCHMPPLWGLAI